MGRRQKIELYEYYYPHYFSWEQAIWIMQNGDLVKVNNKKYKVVSVARTAVPGAMPTILIKEEEDDTRRD